MPYRLFSTKIKPAETRYSAFDQELLAIYLANKQFRHFVKGRKFYVITDHKPLTFALTSKPSQHSPQQVRHLDYISQITTDIRHIKGEEIILLLIHSHVWESFTVTLVHRSVFKTLLWRNVMMTQKYLNYNLLLIH